jgi:hypothetical protein
MSGPSDKPEKSEKADKKAKPHGIPLPTGATDLRSRVPDMADDALATLQVNAKKMLASGNAAQKAMAGDLLPVIEAEIADRKAKKAAATPARKPPTRKVKTPPPSDGGGAAST